MKTFILFIFGEFESHDEIEFFVNEVIGDSERISELKYIIEDFKNIIVIFESESTYVELSQDVYSIMDNDYVNFYFLFDREGLVTANIPKTLKDIIFKPKLTTPQINEIDLNIDLDIDEILEKIHKTGIETLTDEERDFLDNF